MFAAAPWIIDAAPYESTMGLVTRSSSSTCRRRGCSCSRRSSPAWPAPASCSSKRPARRRDWALAAAELAVLFGALTLVTGPLWARKAWGVWWVWDARLTSSLMLFLIFVGLPAAAAVRRARIREARGRLALFGMANVPFIYVSVNVWRTLHPKTSVVPTLPVEMGGPLWFCVAAFLLLFLALLSLRARSSGSARGSKRSIWPRTKRDATPRACAVLTPGCCCRRTASARRSAAAAAARRVRADRRDPARASRFRRSPGRGGLRLRLGGGARLRVVARPPAEEGRRASSPTRIAERPIAWKSACRPPRTSSSFPGCC